MPFGLAAGMLFGRMSGADTARTAAETAAISSMFVGFVLAPAFASAVHVARQAVLDGRGMADAIRLAIEMPALTGLVWGSAGGALVYLVALHTTIDVELAGIATVGAIVGLASGLLGGVLVGGTRLLRRSS